MQGNTGSFPSPPTRSPQGHRMEREYQRIEEYVIEREADEDSAVNQLMRLGFSRYESWMIHGQQQILSQLLDIEEKLEEVK